MTRRFTKMSLIKAAVFILGFLLSLLMIYLINKRILNCPRHLLGGGNCRYFYHYLSIFFISLSFTFLLASLHQIGSWLMSPNRLAIFVGILVGAYMLAIDRFALLPLGSSRHHIEDVWNNPIIFLIFLPAGFILHFTVAYFSSIFLSKFQKPKAFSILAVVIFLAGFQFLGFASFKYYLIHFFYLIPISYDIFQIFDLLYCLIFILAIFLYVRSYMYLAKNIYDGSRFKFILLFLFLALTSFRAHFHYLVFLGAGESWTGPKSELMENNNYTVIFLLLFNFALQTILSTIIGGIIMVKIHRKWLKE